MKAKPSIDGKKPDVLRRLRLAAWCFAALIALSAWPAWKWIARTYGPRSGSSSQCLICARDRSVDVVCRRQVADRIESNQYSDWVDTLVPPEHEHLWYASSSSRREHWFGGEVMACGRGMSVVPMIYRRRAELGEEQAGSLVHKFHKLVTDPGVPDRFTKIETFRLAVHDNPESLLDEDP